MSIRSKLNERLRHFATVDPEASGISVGFALAMGLCAAIVCAVILLARP